MAFHVLLRSCYIALVLIKFATTCLQLCSSFQLPPLATIHHHTKRGTNESTTTTRRYNFIDDFLEEASLERRTSIGEEPVMFAGEDDVETGTTFDFKRWEMHRSSNRYSRMLIGVLFSSTTRRIAPKTLLFVAFSVVVDFYDFIANPVGEYPSTLSSTDIFSLPQLQLPIIPFELTAPVLGLLLVFRTDAAYERFKSGSSLTWGMTASTRNVMRRFASWTARDICTDTERTAGRDLIDACCILHGWIMGEYLRGEKANDAVTSKFLEQQPSSGDDGDWIGGSFQTALLHKALAVRSLTEEERTAINVEELDRLGENMTPSLAMTAISLGATQRLPSLTDQENISIDDCFAELTTNLASCEKLLRTPIPLGYTRYAVRFLWIWLILLPFALVRPFYEFGEQPILVLAMLFISYVFLSIEDIAVQIEEPFVTLPLELHQKWLLWDAEQMQALMRWTDKRRECEEGSISSSIDRQLLER